MQTMHHLFWSTFHVCGCVQHGELRIGFYFHFFFFWRLWWNLSTKTKAVPPVYGATIWLDKLFSFFFFIHRFQSLGITQRETTNKSMTEERPIKKILIAKVSFKCQGASHVNLKFVQTLANYLLERSCNPNRTSKSLLACVPIASAEWPNSVAILGDTFAVFPVILYPFYFFS